MQTDMSAAVLIERYEALVELYRRLDAVTGEVFRLIQVGPRAGELAVRMKENAAIADSIGTVSHEVAALKGEVLGTDLLTPGDRDRLRGMEEEIAAAVNHLVEQQSRTTDIVKRQGIRIARR